MAKKLCMLTLNAQGLRNKKKRHKLYEWMKCQKYGILFLQETHFTDEICRVIENEIIDLCFAFHSVGTTNSCGVSIFIKKDLPVQILNYENSGDGRYIYVNIELDDTYYTLANIYAPNDTKLRNIFFKKQIEKINKYKKGTLIIGGDFNEVLSGVDRKTQNRNVSKIYSTYGLKQLKKQFKLKDIWRIRNKNKRQFTWRRKLAGNFSRIDYLLVEDNVIENSKKCDIRPTFLGIL